jgi:hypothetical protein
VLANLGALRVMDRQLDRVADPVVSGAIVSLFTVIGSPALLTRLWPSQAA